MSRFLTALCVLTAVAAAAISVSTAAARTDRQRKDSPPTLLWKSFPLTSATKATPRTKAAKAKQNPRPATPPEPRRKPLTPPRPKVATIPKPRPKAAPRATTDRRAASYQISTDQPGFPRALLLAVLLAGLLVVGAAVLVGRGLVSLPQRRHRATRERSDDLLERPEDSGPRDP